MNGLDMIYGALLGFVATEMDKTLIEEGVNIPLGSIIFVITMGIICYTNYIKNKKRSEEIK